MTILARRTRRFFLLAEEAEPPADGFLAARTGAFLITRSGLRLRVR